MCVLESSRAASRSNVSTVTVSSRERVATSMLLTSFVFNSRFLDKMVLALDRRPFMTAGNGSSAGDDRPAPGKFLVDLQVEVLTFKHIVARVDGVDRALGATRPAIDAFFVIDDQHVLAVAKGIDGPDFDAVRVLAEDAGFGVDMSHVVHGVNSSDQ